MAKKTEPNLPPDQETKPLSYFEQRMLSLGITAELNNIALWKYDAEKKENVLENTPVFQEVEGGIRIMVYTLDRSKITFSNQETKQTQTGHEIQTAGSRWKKDFYITRLEKPIVKGNDVIKYLIPKGGGTYPFFPPALVEKFEQKIPMKTVYLTEGYFKAFKASLHGVDIIGLSSITHMKDKATGGLHEDIIRLVKSGLVERFVWLTDGDCLDVTQKEITEDKDLYTRPYGFYSSITTFKTLLDDYENIEKWFMHIDTDAILQEDKKITRDQVKGLDDLLVHFKGKEDDIVKDLKSLSRSGFYFQRFNISNGTGKVWKYFHLGDVNDFFLFHSDRRPEMKSREFKFHGTRYTWNEHSNLCDVVMPGAANLYFRVGDYYYKFIEKPNQHKKIEKVFEERKKTTITDDHGKGFCKHVPKYEAFCNVPDHSNFQQVIHNCFNVYSPLDYEPEEEKCTPEDFPAIMQLVRHIFGDKKLYFTNKETKVKHEYENWELGMDYLQLLYTDPSQKLPILCLVSRQNKTGKSTLGFFLRAMLGANVAIVGNADLANDFNAHWATKSVVICDETKIDKHQVIEKIKNYSTALKIWMNAKGKGQVELDCFIKFILITNNEDTFITANEEDTRYWVIKVPVISKEDPKVMSKIVDEIPSFLSYLNERKLVTDFQSRMWFHDDLIKTEALRRVIAQSEPVIIKEIRAGLRELFLDTGDDEILMTAEVIMKELVPKRYERNYLHTMLKDKMKVHQYHVWTVDTREKEYDTQDEAIAAAEILFPDDKGLMIMGRIKAKFKPCRYTYPAYIEKFEDGTKERVLVNAKDNGRPYVFKRKDFVTNEEDAMVDIGPEKRLLAKTAFTGSVVAAELDGPRDDRSKASSELPFG